MRDKILSNAIKLATEMQSNRQETFICTRCEKEHEIDFRVASFWDVEEIESDWSSYGRDVFVEICGNCEAYENYDTCGIDPIPCNNCDDDLPF